MFFTLTIYMDKIRRHFYK